jgi:hypothetical protein
MVVKFRKSMAEFFWRAEPNLTGRHHDRITYCQMRMR